MKLLPIPKLLLTFMSCLAFVSQPFTSVAVAPPPPPHGGPLQLNSSSSLVWSTESAGSIAGFEVEDSPGPDITFTKTPIADSPWSEPIIASIIPRTFDITELRTDQYTYVDWAFINQGAGTTVMFTNCLYLEDQLVLCVNQPGLEGGATEMVIDRILSFPPPDGQHSLKVVFDVNNTIAETDETNNTVEVDFYWEVPEDYPDLVPFRPEGWSYPVVPASDPKTTIFFSLRAEETTYVNWSIKNLSNVPVTGSFEICLYLDDPLNLDCWMVEDGLGQMATYEIHDAELPGPQPGEHVLVMMIDPQNTIPEANNDNNTWDFTFTWYLPDTCGPFVVPEVETSMEDTTGKAEGFTLISPSSLQSGWIPIMVEDFESDFPSSNGWRLEDRISDDNCTYLWGPDDHHLDPINGGQSAGWPAAGGLARLDPAETLYPPNMDSWMIYGPFDLSSPAGPMDARLSFDLWREIEGVVEKETTRDYLFVGASVDGVTFSGLTYSGDLSSWTTIRLSLSDFAGQPEVWIAFRFVSDPNFQSAGPWIDNILLERAGPKLYLPVIRNP